MIRRAAETQVRDSLADTPVVLIHGPRQAGKSTLARSISSSVPGMKDLTLDDPIPLDFATRDPAGFIASLDGPVLIDEVQRAPGLFLAIKAAVDRDRKPGRFLLTGSANVMALPKMSDSLAGRMEVVDLLPFGRFETLPATSRFTDAVFDGWPKSPAAVFDLESTVEMITVGGFPEPFQRPSSARRNAWFANYIRTLLERDVRDLANIEGLTQLPRLLSLIAARAGQPLNVVGLARETGIPNTSLHRYLDLLKAVFLLKMVPAWSNDPDTRLTRTSKAYLVDTGLLAYLLNQSPKSILGQPGMLRLVLENFVALELMKQGSVSEMQPTLHHLRTVRHLSVDFVLESRGGQLIGIDLVDRPSVVPSDADGLRFLRDIAGDRFVRGVVLYLGNEEVNLEQGIKALPIASLWS